MPQQDSRLPVLLLILFIIWMFPDPQPQPLGAHSSLDRTLEREAEELHVLNTTAYGDLDPENRKWVNITGLKEEDGFAWEALGLVRARAKEQVFHILGEEDGRTALDRDDGTNLPVYRNISGDVRGSWKRAQIDNQIRRPQLNMSEILPWDARVFERDFERNITGGGGDLRFEFLETDDLKTMGRDRVRKIRAEATISDETSVGDGWRTVLYGTHFVDTGQVILTTTSKKFSGMWALPHLSLTERIWDPMKESVIDRIQAVIRKQESHELQRMNPYSSSPDGIPENEYAPHCELVVYLQQHSLQILQPDGTLVAPSLAMIKDMEHEMRFPEGARPYVPPPLRLSALIFSPDCGFAIESQGPPEYSPAEGNHLVGEKTELSIRKSIDWTMLFGLVIAAQVYLTIMQMKHASTPSTRSRISVYTVGLLALGDGFTGMAFLPMGLMFDAAFPVLLSTAFFAFISTTFFDMKFLVEVWWVQVQERRRIERLQPTTTTEPEPTAPTTTTTTPMPTITAAGADNLPLPITARRSIDSGATPITLPPDQDNDQTTPGTPETEAATARRERTAMYGKYYFLLLGITFLSLHAHGWYPGLRTAYANLLVFVYASFWVPQIYRNVMRNCRKALLYRFVLGQSVLRLLPVAYFYCYEDNVLWLHTDRRAFLGVAAWVWCQVWVLLVQDVLGPRIGVPRGWVPEAYDYHPVLSGDEEDARMPIGFATTMASEEPGSPSVMRAPESKDRGKRMFDCAICMQNIEVPVVPSASGGGGAAAAAAGPVEGSMMHNLVARRLYMVTPCRHIFHTKCLEAAMRYRLQCPICREGLPPL